jgi:predicted RNase H-like nuclease (RuvC/YqgF family)
VAKNKQQPTGRALSAEQVLEREVTRFEERVERARKELADAEHELERVQVALNAMREVERSTQSGNARPAEPVPAPGQPGAEPDRV